MDTTQQHDDGSLTRICRDCQAAFDLDLGSIAWFADRGLDLPRRCPACRRARKAARAHVELQERA